MVGRHTGRRRGGLRQPDSLATRCNRIPRLLLRTPAVDTIYEFDRIKLAQAGLIMVGIGNGLTVIFMGLYEVRRPSP